MKRLVLPDGVCSLTIDGVSYDAKGGVIEVDDNHVRAALDHDGRIREFSAVDEIEAGDREPTDAERAEAMIGIIKTAPRSSLFLIAKDFAAAIPASTSTDNMRSILEKHFTDRLDVDAQRRAAEAAADRAEAARLADEQAAADQKAKDDAEAAAKAGDDAAKAAAEGDGSQT